MERCMYHDVDMAESKFESKTYGSYERVAGMTRLITPFAAGCCGLASDSPGL